MNVSASQVNVNNVPAFQRKLQDTIDEFESIRNMQETDDFKCQAIADVLNRLG